MSTSQNVRQSSRNRSYNGKSAQGWTICSENNRGKVETQPGYAEISRNNPQDDKRPLETSNPTGKMSKQVTQEKSSSGQVKQFVS
jgi:hypothetical protein